MGKYCMIPFPGVIWYRLIHRQETDEGYQGLAGGVRGVITEGV